MTSLLPLSNKAPTVSDRPEVELLLCCARTRIDAKTAERIRSLLQQDIDWAYLIQTAARHGMMPLLYQGLSTTCPEAIPKPILNQLRIDFHAKSLHNLFLTKELLKLLNFFKDHNIPVIPFKGPVLAASAYGNLALRQFGDLDILVHQRDFLRAKNLLISQKYQLHMNLGWESHFVHEDSSATVDLHQAIMPMYFSFPLDFEQLWCHLEPLSVNGTNVSSLRPEDLLLILCAQWGKDCCCQWQVRLAQLCDAAELLSVHPRLDWTYVIEQARSLGSERMLKLYLFLVSEMLGTALPEEVLNRLQADPVVKSLALQVRSRLFCEASGEPEASEEGSFCSYFWSYNHRFYFRMRKRLPDRITYCIGWLRNFLYFALIPNEKDWALLPLPKVFYVLYYPLHVIRLVVKHGLSPGKTRYKFYIGKLRGG